jgi:hypothetical protein
MLFVQMLKGKLLVTVIASILLLAGATAVFAATPAGQDMLGTITHGQNATATATPDSKSHSNVHRNTGNQKQSCPGLSEAQQLASKHGLSSDSKSQAVLAICALHQGAFQGKTASGTSYSSSRVYGYGEIDMLLTYSQYLAAHDKANTDGKLTAEDLGSYLAQAVQSCGTTPVEVCLKTNIPGFQPGNGDGNGARPTNTPAAGHGNGNGNGKPTSTPTPPAHQ